MLHKLAMAGSVAFAKLQPSYTSALRAGARYSLPAPHFRRSLTGGETREAARNAKAHLLRATTVADASFVDKQSGLAQSNFMDLRVDDRVVVNLPLCLCPSVTRYHAQLRTQHSVLCITSCILMQGRLREIAVLEPTAVQQAAIPAILSGRNVAMQCYTGSGKVHTLYLFCPSLSIHWTLQYICYSYMLSDLHLHQHILSDLHLQLLQTDLQPTCSSCHACPRRRLPICYRFSQKQSRTLKRNSSG